MLKSFKKGIEEKLGHSAKLPRFFHPAGEKSLARKEFSVVEEKTF